MPEEGNMTEIVDVKARQILDSRGNPTVEVDVAEPVVARSLDHVLDVGVSDHQVRQAADVLELEGLVDPGLSQVRVHEQRNA